MKRNLFGFIFISLVIALSFSFAACSQVKEATYDNSSPTNITAAPQVTETPTDIIDILSFPYGSYVLYDIENSDILTEKDVQIEFHDEETGTMFIFDFDNNNFQARPFNYLYDEKTLTIDYSDGNTEVYDVMFTEVGDLWLFGRENASAIYYFSYWNSTGIFPNEYEFTALGAWVLPLDDGTFSTVCFWPTGRGYSYNWSEKNDNIHSFLWEYNYGTLQIDNNDGSAHIEYTVNHMGNVLQLESADKSTFYRVNGDLLNGYYNLYYTDDYKDTVSSMELHPYGKAKFTTVKNDNTVVYEQAYWSINAEDGKLIINLDGDKNVKYDYFYTDTSLLLYDVITGYSYELSKSVQ